MDDRLAIRKSVIFFTPAQFLVSAFKCSTPEHFKSLLAKSSFLQLLLFPSPLSRSNTRARAFPCTNEQSVKNTFPKTSSFALGEPTNLPTQTHSKTGSSLKRTSFLSCSIYKVGKLCCRSKLYSKPFRIFPAFIIKR